MGYQVLQRNPFPGTLYCARQYKRQLGARRCCTITQGLAETISICFDSCSQGPFASSTRPDSPGKRVEVDIGGALLRSGGRSLFRRERFTDTH